MLDFLCYDTSGTFPLSSGLQLEVCVCATSPGILAISSLHVVNIRVSVSCLIVCNCDCARTSGILNYCVPLNVRRLGSNTAT